MVGGLIRATINWADDVTRHWIGWSVPPALAAIDAAGWEPDPTSAWCTRCGMSVGTGEATRTGCASCRSVSAIGDGVIRLGAYNDPLRGWIHRIKYHGWTEMGDTLGVLLAQQMIAIDPPIDLEKAIVVPVPMPFARRVYRGIDHAAVIATSLAAELDIPIRRSLRRSMGATQITRSRSARRHARMGIHPRRSARRLRGMDIILVDDVLTTGGTLRAAARTLRSMGVRRVYPAVLAVTTDPARRPPA